MNDKEIKVFQAISDMFGYNTSRVIFNLYVGFLHDMKMLGLILSIPFKFIEFYKKAANERKHK